MLDLNLTAVGWPHTVASLVAMVAFVPIMLTRKGGYVHRMAGRVYVFSYVALCLTAFGIYSQQRFWFPHWTAVAGLAALAAGYLAVRAKPRGWRHLHLVAMLLSAYNLFGGAVNEAFLRIVPLRAIVGPDITNDPIVGMTHGIVMTVFAATIAVYVGLAVVGARHRGSTAASTR